MREDILTSNSSNVVTVVKDSIEISSYKIMTAYKKVSIKSISKR